MISRRRLIAASGALALLGFALPARAAASDPAITVETFYAALLSVMKEGKQLGFAGRRDRLAPAIRDAFDLPQMTRLTVGPQWTTLAPTDQKQLVDSFSSFSIAVYASRFDDYSGESFAVDHTATLTPDKDAVVHTKLVRSKDTPVQLDYLLRESGGTWRIIDVYLSGTVSELATRRSEFSSVLRSGGPAALVQLLKQKTRQLGG